MCFSRTTLCIFCPLVPVGSEKSPSENVANQGGSQPSSIKITNKIRAEGIHVLL